MWSCDCQEDGTFDSRHFSLKATEIDKDEVCVKCGNYAVWDNLEDMRKDKGALLDKSVTVFRLKEGVHKYFTDVHKASIYAGYVSKHALPRNMKNKKHWYSKNLGTLTIIGNHKEIPLEFKQFAKPKKIYAFDYNTGELLASGIVSKVSKKVGELESTIMSNLQRGTIKTRKGIVFSENKDFNLEGYKAAMEIPSENDFANWKHDVISYDDDEMGVKYEEDTYGTWKDLLYS